MQQRDPVGEVEGLFLFMGHQHGGDTDGIDQVPQFAARSLAKRGIEVG